MDKQQQNKKRFKISFASLVAAIVMFFLVDSQITIDIALVWMLLSFIGLCVFGFIVLKAAVTGALKEHRARVASEQAQENKSNNEYECQNCKKVLKHADIFKSKDYSEILAGFICSECGFQIYPHYRDIVKQKQSKAWEHWFVSAIAVFAIFGLISVSANWITALVFCIAFLVSCILFLICISGSMFNSKIKILDEYYQNTDRNDNVQSSNRATEFIDGLIINKGIHFNRFLSYQALEKNIAIDETLKNTLPEYVRQRIIETGKSDLECLFDESVSKVKKVIFEDYHIDMAILDEEIAQLHKCIPVNINALREGANPSQSEDLTKAELREQIQDNLNDVNNFYSVQIVEAKKILELGVKEYYQYDFEDDIKILDNLKFYPDYSVDFDWSDYQEKYQNNEKEAVEFFVSRILGSSAYPIYVKKEFELEYNPDNGILALNYKLPNIEEILNISEVSYISAKNDFKVSTLKEKELNELYDNILYQIALRTNFEIFKSDSASHIKAIVFNGWLEYVDGADGIEKTACIMTMQTTKEDFMAINLNNVEPQKCFRKLKGISSRNLYDVIPVNPIITVNKKDRKFVESYEVMHKLNEGVNISAMPWLDFEHLVREILEKEYCHEGCEIRTTISSHDGGIDCIIYDPDPIKGGMIIVQAKRYNNVVPVSAVRELYGSMTHERAMKGLLLTTAHYGVESYSFVEDKPITLIDGQQLLNMLKKHGYKARIDIEEAKAILKQQEAK